MVDLTPRGFEPPTLKLKAGKVAFVVRDRIYLGEIDLSLDRMDSTGRTVVETLARRESPQNKWQEYRTVEPGRYRLTDHRFPEWHCEIVVEK